MIVTYGKKPRKSKSIEVYNLEDLSFFLYNTKSKTKGITYVYYNVEPYPLIMVSQSNEKAKTILSNNLTRVRDLIASMDLSDTITQDEYDKPIKEEEDTIKDNWLTLEECQLIQNKIIQDIKNEQSTRDVIKTTI